MKERIKLFEHPTLGEKYIEFHKNDYNYYINLLRQFFEYFLDHELTIEQISICATIIKEFIIKNEVFEEEEALSKIIRLATYISGFSAIKSEDRLEGMIERVRKYLY